MLQAHVDVVSTTGQQWTHPPFAGEVADGFVWGRGALDMKAGAAMFVAAALRAAVSGMQPAGDVVLALLCDEEAGGDLGAAHLVRERPDLLEGVRYSLGEFGGFTPRHRGAAVHPIQVAEKQVCVLRATVRGPWRAWGAADARRHDGMSGEGPAHAGPAAAAGPRDAGGAADDRGGRRRGARPGDDAVFRVLERYGR